MPIPDLQSSDPEAVHRVVTDRYERRDYGRDLERGISPEREGGSPLLIELGNMHLAGENPVIDLQGRRWRGLSIGRNSQVDKVIARIGGTLVAIDPSAPYIGPIDGGNIRLSHFYTRGNAATDGCVGDLSVELWPELPAVWPGRGPDHSRGLGNDKWTAETVGATTEAELCRIPTYGRSIARVKIADVGTVSHLFRIEGIARWGSSAGEESESALWPDPDDATAFETITTTDPAGKFVIDVEGWEMIRVMFKLASGTTADFRWAWEIEG